MIIGIGHQSRVGKDLVADILYRKYRFHKRAFADALKDLCDKVFDLPIGAFDDYTKDKPLERWGKSPRQLIQEFGQLMKENWGEDFWCRKLEHFLDYRGGLPNGEYRCSTDWVIPDVRFPLETEHIKKWGGYLLHLTGERRGEMGDFERAHISEHALDDFDGWDITIHNDGTIEDLEKEVDTFMKWLTEESK